MPTTTKKRSRRGAKEEDDTTQNDEPPTKLSKRNGASATGDTTPLSSPKKFAPVSTASRGLQQPSSNSSTPEAREEGTIDDLVPPPLSPASRYPKNGNTPKKQRKKGITTETSESSPETQDNNDSLRHQQDGVQETPGNSSWLSLWQPLLLLFTISVLLSSHVSSQYTIRNLRHELMHHNLLPSNTTASTMMVTDEREDQVLLLEQLNQSLTTCRLDVEQLQVQYKSYQKETEETLTQWKNIGHEGAQQETPQEQT